MGFIRANGANGFLWIYCVQHIALKFSVLLLVDRWALLCLNCVSAVMHTKPETSQKHYIQLYFSLYKLFRLVIRCQHDGTPPKPPPSSVLRFQPCSQSASVLVFKKVSMKEQKRIIKLVHSPLKTRQISGEKGERRGPCLWRCPLRPRQRDNDTGEQR